MPATFPETDFRAFGLAASTFFPAIISDEALSDPQEKRRHFDWSWRTVRYRYRSCAECNDEFRALLNNTSEEWREWGDEELTYKLERCIYLFFMSGLSMFDSFAFCLYFVGHAIRPAVFPDVVRPHNITRKATVKAFRATFSEAKITRLLEALLDDPRGTIDPRFRTIDEVRNVVGHRLSGRRSTRGSGTTHADGTHTTHWQEETWSLPGAVGKLSFDEELLQRYLGDITSLLTPLASAAREFADSQQGSRS